MPEFSPRLRRWNITQIFVALLVVGAVVCLLVPSLVEWLAFNPATVSVRPWTLFTYPLVVGIGGGPFGPIFLVFLLLMVYQFGIAVEAELGRSRYIATLLAAILVPSLLFLALAFSYPAASSPLIGPIIPVAVILAIWATRNAGAQVMFWGIIPMKGMWLGALAAVGVFAMYYAPSAPGIIRAIFGLLPMGLGWAFAANRLPGPLRWSVPLIQRKSKAEEQREIDFLAEVKRREKDRDEKERLRRLLEGPAADDER